MSTAHGDTPTGTPTGFLATFYQTVYGSAPTETPKGLLSFLYNVIYNHQTTEQCRNNIQQAMDSFALTAAQQTAVRQTQNDGSAQDGSLKSLLALLNEDQFMLDKLMELLTPDLADDYHIVW